jgi:four helix bundle protein
MKNTKLQIKSKHQIQNSRQYDLEERTLTFSKRIVDICKKVEKNTVNFKITDQLIRSGTSVGANYREANETDTKRDFLHRIRIAKKEAKETTYWLKLLKHANQQFTKEIDLLIQESIELMKILASIYEKSKFKRV